MFYKSLLSVALIVSLSSCSQGDPSSQGDSSSVDKHPAKSTFNESTAPKKIASKPCSKYNLKFYEGDIREFDQRIIRLGMTKSDANIQINGKSVAILGFEGQSEEYINYSLYRGISYKKSKDISGAILSTKTETQIIICFRKDIIAVKQLIENVRARGSLTKAQYMTKQWTWQVKGT
jgi:hypothetical protein